MAYDALVTRSDVAARIPESVSNAMLTSLSATSAALQLGTRINVPTNQTRFPVLSALPTAYWVNGDTGLKQTSEAAWSNKYINIEEIATIVPIPEAVVDDTGFDVWDTLRPLMEGAIARVFDSAVFFGTNAPDSFPDDLVTSAVAAGNVVARGTSNPASGGLYGDYVATLATLYADGYRATGAVGNIENLAREMAVRASDGQLLTRPPQMPDVNYAMDGLWPTGLSAAEVIVGDFTKLVVGVRRDMTYKLLDQAVITDASGNIVYNLAQQDMIAMRLVFRAGWQVSNPINYKQAIEGSRFPFAILRSPSS